MLYHIYYEFLAPSPSLLRKKSEFHFAVFSLEPSQPMRGQESAGGPMRDRLDIEFYIRLPSESRNN